MSLDIARIRYFTILTEFKNIDNIFNNINKFKKFITEKYYNFNSTILEFTLLYFEYNQSYDFCKYLFLLHKNYKINIYHEIETLSLKNIINKKT